MTVTDVRGTGSSAAARETIGTDYVIRLPVRLRIEMIVPDDLVEPIIETVLKHAQTGQPDDGKIFVYPIEDTIRIRTEEHGNDAI
jgi:nitrogen regulatory protein P-II 1